MIVTEQYYIGSRLFNRVYSDAERYVVRDGVAYSEACDLAEYGRTYTEGELIPDEAATDSDKAEAYDILMGVSE